MYDLISRKAAIDMIRAERDKSIMPKEWHDGMNIAIFCLIHLQPVQSETCGDAVSRNAIVQKLNEMDRYVSTELRLCDTDKKFPQNEVFIVDDVYEEIEQLLPVQPEPRMGYWEGNQPNGRYRCSEYSCLSISNDDNFCSNCGADMRGERIYNV